MGIDWCAVKPLGREAIQHKKNVPKKYNPSEKALPGYGRPGKYSRVLAFCRKTIVKNEKTALPRDNDRAIARRFGPK
ncbi:hypothetical protein GCM10007390_09270 [Persicitalea jodogahamensis]|uniref:Uncharacterized protein n=1 Tax=Persicitalea jodogahamensis TaxID=402147 RepID=A0A8J3D4D2_9BACT|nr:hypothetical protein GCM10007390_09270 [Persicitalea jodogahamensis]